MLSRRAQRLWLFGTLIWVTLALLSAGAECHVARAERPAGRLARHRAEFARRHGLTCGMFTPAFYLHGAPLSHRGDRWWSALPRASRGIDQLRSAQGRGLTRHCFALLNAENPRSYRDVLFSGFYADWLAYWGRSRVIHAIEYYRESRERELEATQLALENLRSQLQPHFLFNTLQSISTLIHRDPAAADRMLTDLSDLLRLSLRSAASQEVPLRDELDFLARYLEIMRVRFGDRLVIRVDVNADVLNAMVPSLVLQPIVENAIRHGMADRSRRRPRHRVGRAQW